MYKIEVKSIAELAGAAKQFINHFEQDKLFAFYGEMGAGKTTFIKALCQEMGTDSNITSPTFALVNEYETTRYGNIYHFDFYRLNEITEALDIGFDDYMNSGNYCFMEWPERVEALLPDNVIEVKIEILDDTSRLISTN